MFKISKEDRQKLLNYLKTRPFEEVFLLIPLLVGLQSEKNSKESETNSKDKDREDWKETKGINKIPKPIKKDN